MDPIEDLTIAVIAKEPVAGRVKTRLCPPCTPEQAAAIAEAGLAATLTTVAQAPAARRVLVLEGRPGPWLPAGFDVVDQQPGGLDRRLSAAFAGCLAARPGDRVVLVGMDTPQLTVAHLTRAAAALRRDRDAVLGPAPDGGYWLIGLRHLVPGAIDGVPMSVASTFARQRDQLARRGYHVRITDTLTDVDHAADAVAIAALMPATDFAAVVTAAIPRVNPTVQAPLIDR